MRHTYNTDPLANEEEETRDEDAYSRWQEDLSEREREEKAEQEYINRKIKIDKIFNHQQTKENE